MEQKQLAHVKLLFPAPVAGDANARQILSEQQEIRAFLEAHHADKLSTMRGALETAVEKSLSFADFTRAGGAIKTGRAWVDAHLGRRKGDEVYTVSHIVPCNEGVLLNPADQKAFFLSVSSALEVAAGRKVARGVVISVANNELHQAVLASVILSWRAAQDPTPDLKTMKVWIGATATSFDTTSEVPPIVAEVSLVTFLEEEEEKRKKKNGEAAPKQGTKPDVARGAGVSNSDQPKLNKGCGEVTLGRGS
jgi:hypothetical protein